MAHDGRGSPRNCEGMPALPGIQGRSALGSSLSDKGVCPIGVSALRLHQHRVHDGAEQATRGEEHPHDDGPFHEVFPGSSEKGPDCQDCHEGVL